MSYHTGCCGCHLTMGRRGFLAGLSATSMGVAVAAAAAPGEVAPRAKAAMPFGKDVPLKTLVVQPVLTYQLYEPREARSWRPWGGLHSQADVDTEANRIREDLATLSKSANFAMEMRPLATVRGKSGADALRDGDADVMLIFAADGQPEALISENRYNLVFVRHRSGPVYLWYEIVHPRLLRKTVDEYGQPGLSHRDVVVDEYGDVLMRLRALYALKNTVGSKIVAVGDASGWGKGGQTAPGIAANLWKMDIIPVSYDDLGKRIESTRADTARCARAEAEAAEYLGVSNTTLETDAGYVTRAFQLKYVFDDLMRETGAPAITVNECMTTIMPMSQTTACLVLSMLNDAGALAFCESDFVVIPSGVLLRHVAQKPVFLQDPTYPHHGVITLAHCTAPRRMDGEHLEPVRLQTHYESDYGVAPRVEMTLGQAVTVLDPDFASQRWLGFQGEIVDNPAMDICRSQIDIRIDGDWHALENEMRGFHWMLSYGSHLSEIGYALHKMGVDWLDLSSSHVVAT